MIKKLASLFLCCFFFITGLQAQDTVQVSLEEFIRIGIENSGQVAFERQNVELAENQVEQANSNRYLPNFELSTQHGVVPGVESDVPGLSRNEFYLDPNLENDWENWAVFTRAEISAVQPLFTWGALRNAVKAAESAATAAKERFEMQKADIEIRLFELYQSYLLTSEIMRLLDEAENTIGDIEQQINEKKEEEDSDIDESEVFKFEIFKSEFAMQAAEVRENAEMTKRIWNYVLRTGSDTEYIPASQFLDPLPEDIRDLGYYRSNAVTNRSEIKAVEAGINAADHGVKANKFKSYPALFLGLSGSFAATPNRPRQSNPFIINNTNFATGAVGVGIRQNLDFFSINADIEKSRIQYDQAKFLKEAALDGIILELNDAYKKASLSKLKVEKTDEALVTGKKWLRQEQLDYDFGIGDTKDLIDAMQKELELRVELQRRIFEFNNNMAELYRAAGFPIRQLTNNEK